MSPKAQELSRHGFDTALLIVDEVIKQWEYVDTYVSQTPHLKFWYGVKDELLMAQSTGRMVEQVRRNEEQITELYRLNNPYPETIEYAENLKKETTQLYLELSTKLPLRYICLRPTSSAQARVYVQNGICSTSPPGDGYDMYITKGNDIEGPIWLLAATCEVKDPIASTVDDGLIDLSEDFVNFAINKKFALYERPDHRTNQ